jgi:hypothetical protein
MTVGVGAGLLFMNRPTFIGRQRRKSRDRHAAAIETQP